MYPATESLEVRLIIWATLNMRNVGTGQGCTKLGGINVKFLLCDMGHKVAAALCGV